jgi:hypothetical protein
VSHFCRFPHLTGGKGRRKGRGRKGRRREGEGKEKGRRREGEGKKKGEEVLRGVGRVCVGRARGEEVGGARKVRGEGDMFIETGLL